MDIIITLFSLVVLLFSVIIHELSHGYVASSLGDPTAKYAGRLTLNPIKHLDLFGSIILPFLLFIAGAPFLVGWAKPVPINPYNFKDQTWGSFKVAIAGPISNMVLAVLFGLIMRLVNVSVFAAAPGLLLVFSFIVQINIMLALFNLIPIPPLDGHWILFTFLPEHAIKVRSFLQQYGIFILLILIFIGGLQGLSLIGQYIYHLITGM